VQLGIEAYALYLLFTPPGGDCSRSRRARVLSHLPPLPKLRPRAVTRAMLLLWLAVLLGALQTLATFTLSAKPALVVLLLVASA